jgi:glycine cleavage system H protein
MSDIPNNLKYTTSHEWILLKDDIAIVGVTEYAQNQLGDIVFVEIETEGQKLGKDEVFGTIEAVKTVADLLMPVAGEIVEVNPALANKPEIINHSPYDEGWLVKMKVENVKDVDELMDAKAYKAVIG